MCADSNRDKINMIGAYLIQYYDINDEKAAKPMTIPNSNIEKNRNLPHLTLISLEFTPSYLARNQIKHI